MSKPIALLTSVTGSVGNEVFKQLNATGKFNIRIATTGKSYEKQKAQQLVESLSKEIDLQKVDIRDSDAINNVLKDVNYVFLCFPTSWIDAKVNPNTEEEILFNNFIQGVKNNSSTIRHVVYISAVDATPSNPVILFRNHGYHEDTIKKLVADARESGKPFGYTIIRCGAFYDDYEKYNLMSIQHGDVIFGSAGDGKLCGIAVSDIGAVVVKVLANRLHSGKTYTLSTAPAYSHAEAAAILSKAVGRKITYVNKTDDEQIEFLAGMGMPREFAEDVTRINIYRRNNKVLEGTTDANDILGRDPITFKQWATAHAAAFEKPVKSNKGEGQEESKEACVTQV